MREHSQTTPRRRGPKIPLPRAPYEERFDVSESPYYSIDNTEDIYGTTLSASQRCYVDPWDLENYDYVRKKLESGPSTPTSDDITPDYYETSSSPSPAGEPVSSKYYYMPQQTSRRSSAYCAPSRLASTMPRNRRRNSSHIYCDLECCAPAPPRRTYNDIYNIGGGAGQGRNRNKYEDYMSNMAEHMQNEEADMEQNIYSGYGGFSSSSSTERRSSSIDDVDTPDIAAMMMPTIATNDDENCYGSSIYGGGFARKRSVIPSKPTPKFEFPAPPPVPPTYDYCNPYATLPYCSVSDCYECLSQAQQSASLLYAAPSLYGGGSYSSFYGGSSTLGRRPSSSLYSGIYANKFGLSKKGLLQIDYSCSWNDLDRIIGRNCY